MDKEAQEKIAEIDDYLLNQAMAIWRAGNCIKYRPDEVPIESLRDIIKRWKEFLHSQGVMIKVDGELPRILVRPELTRVEAVRQAQQDMLKEGYVAVEPLVEEE